ncbi:hypothetical protein FSARC_6108 [Fusarium sarcochroum]|uniref:Uncharacterized protein n=1 Tax=Fusarium sarcochroum TaxID=1208366 RepID=A0A8H4TY12_9HYPO|nr:hypothetical protein FSARC_6108 [Fusarium sarcochroum]
MALHPSLGISPASPYTIPKTVKVLMAFDLMFLVQPSADDRFMLDSISGYSPMDEASLVGLVIHQKFHFLDPICRQTTASSHLGARLIGRVYREKYVGQDFRFQRSSLGDIHYPQFAWAIFGIYTKRSVSYSTRAGI